MPGRARFEPYVDASISASRSGLGSRSPALNRGQSKFGKSLDTNKIESTLKHSDMISAGASNRRIRIVTRDESADAVSGDRSHTPREFSSIPDIAAGSAFLQKRFSRWPNELQSAPRARSQRIARKRRRRAVDPAAAELDAVVVRRQHRYAALVQLIGKAWAE